MFLRLKNLPLLMPVVLAALAMLLRFNGLYGQDAHEYLRQSRALFARLCGGQAQVSAGWGEADFAGGYPLAGALLQVLGMDAVLALQVVSVLSAGAVLWLFERLLRVLTPGTSRRSRWLYAALPLALSPLLLRSGLVVMSDAMGLALALAALWQGLLALEPRRRAGAVVWAAGLAVLAVTTRFALVALLLPLLAAVTWQLVQRGRWMWLLTATTAAGLALLPHFWVKNGAETAFLQHSLLQEWSLAHFFQSNFDTPSGTLRHTLPNALYLLFPLVQPAFCLLLPGLFFLVKRTDVRLFSKKILLVCLVAYLTLLGGLPHQNLRYLLPAYVVVLLLLFPAWDRMVAYGSYFFPRLTRGVLTATMAVQVLCAAFFLQPTLLRHRLEQTLAAELRPLLPSGATLFAFDVDVALRSYLPDIQHKNLWVRRYGQGDWTNGSFILFNEPALCEQWAGQNPMLNWAFVQRYFRLRPLRQLSGGWVLYEVNDE